MKNLKRIMFCDLEPLFSGELSNDQTWYIPFRGPDVSSVFGGDVICEFSLCLFYFYFYGRCKFCLCPFFFLLLFELDFVFVLSSSFVVRSSFELSTPNRDLRLSIVVDGQSNLNWTSLFWKPIIIPSPSNVNSVP